MGRINTKSIIIKSASVGGFLLGIFMLNKLYTKKISKKKQQHINENADENSTQVYKKGKEIIRFSLLLLNHDDEDLHSFIDPNLSELGRVKESGVNSPVPGKLMVSSTYMKVYLLPKTSIWSEELSLDKGHFFDYYEPFGNNHAAVWSLQITRLSYEGKRYASFSLEVSLRTHKTSIEDLEPFTVLVGIEPGSGTPYMCSGHYRSYSESSCSYSEITNIQITDMRKVQAEQAQSMQQKSSLELYTRSISAEAGLTVEVRRVDKKRCLNIIPSLNFSRSGRL